MKVPIIIMKSTLMTLAAAMFISGLLLSIQPRGINAATEDATALYKSKCATCHGSDGGGGTAMGKKLNVRDLRAAEVQKQTDAQLQTIIGKGKGKMIGYEKSLGADQVKQLAAYVRQLGKKS